MLFIYAEILRLQKELSTSREKVQKLETEKEKLQREVESLQRENQRHIQHFQHEENRSGALLYIIIHTSDCDSIKRDESHIYWNYINYWLCIYRPNYTDALNNLCVFLSDLMIPVELQETANPLSQSSTS